MRNTLLRTIAGAFALALAASPLVLAQGVTSPYLQIVWRFRAGDVAGGIRAAAALPLAGLRDRVLRDLGPHVCHEVAGSRDCDRVRRQQPDVYATRVLPVWRAAVPAAILLHLQTSSALSVANAADAEETHRRIASMLLDRLATVEAETRSARDAAGTRAFRRRGHLLLVWLLQSGLHLEALDLQLRQSLRAFPGDADLLLASGSLEETLASPVALAQRYATRPMRTVGAGERSGWIQRERAFRLSRAETLYRQVLEAKPALAEAQVRLGRVLFLEDRLDDARTALARVDPSPDVPRLRYLAALFAAAIEERTRGSAAARQRYDAALRVWPAAQAARIGLSRLLARGGDRAGAANLVTALPTEPVPVDLAADPWWWYQFGQAWRLERGFEEFRAELHR